MAENTKNEITTFVSEDLGEIRTINLNGEPWFVASDVCSVLGISNTTMALDRLDEDERSKFNLGRQGEANIISEPGLYSLIMASRKPNAKSFQRWVTHDIIPSIRKTGGYVQQGRENEFLETMFKNMQEQLIDNKTAILALQKQVIAQGKLLDVKPDMKKISNWKNKCGYPKVNVLVTLTGIAFDNVLDMIYDKMTDKAGFVAYSAMVDYKEKYHLDSVPYTIDAVADSPTYQRDFVICANELIREFKRNNATPAPVSTSLDKFDATIRPLIELRGDKSARGAMTLKEVYKKMHTKQSWAVMKGKNKCQNKKQLIMKKDSEYDLFCKTVNEMIKEFK